MGAGLSADPPAAGPAPASSAPAGPTLRRRLLAMALAPLVVVLAALLALLLWWGDAAVDRLLVAKVRSDLAVAEGYFDSVLADVGNGLGALAESQALHQLLQAPGGDPVALLQRVKAQQRLDFVNLRAPDGRLLATDAGALADGPTGPTGSNGPSGPTGPTGSPPPPGPPSSSPPSSPPRPPAMPAGTERGSVEVLEADTLALLAPALRARVAVPLLPTRAAAPTPRRQETRALVLLATRAVRDAQGRLLAQVQGGVLLNRNLRFIDTLNEIVYPEGTLPFGSHGTATLFLGDVRVSTNVRLFAGGGPAERGERALGTRVSQEVHDAVLERGSTWLGRAFVVNDWYVSAYKPLADGQGRRVGMLYVGLWEQPFRVLKWGTMAALVAVVLLAMAGAAWFARRAARAVSHPLERMDATMQRVEGGDWQARVGAVDRGDEIGRLAAHLDRLLATLQGWHAELDAKVAERTRELQAAQAHLLRTEKLATIGQLTAGIAHEVNNPIAVIQGNLDLLRELLPPEAAAQVAPELRLVDAQIERMRRIVMQLLQLARPGEFADSSEPLAPAQLVDDALVLVGHLLARSQVRVSREGQVAQRVRGHRQELLQVLVNLLVNALQAMPQGGTLTLRLRACPAGDAAPASARGVDAGTDAGGDSGADAAAARGPQRPAHRPAEVCIDVVDTGPGLPPEQQAQLFRPFATTKAEGNGLGLWVSRGLVEHSGGRLLAANRADALPGAVFTVCLPAVGGPGDGPDAGLAGGASDGSAAGAVGGSAGVSAGGVAGGVAGGPGG